MKKIDKVSFTVLVPCALIRASEYIFVECRMNAKMGQSVLSSRYRLRLLIVLNTLPLS